MNPTLLRTLLGCLLFTFVVSPLQALQANAEALDVVWKTPSTGAMGSMPLGNGDIGLNAWVDSTGALVFFIGKTDSWGDNGRLLKVGKLRISTEPALSTSVAFEQRLDLEGGRMTVSCGEGLDKTTLEVWVDANHPVVHVTIDGQTKRNARASIELWRTERTAYPSAEVSDLSEDRYKPNQLGEPVFIEADTLIKDQVGRIGWYHFNAKSVGPAKTAELQGLTDYFKGKSDPLLHRIFGALVSAPGATRIDQTQLLSAEGTSHRFSVFVLTEHPSSPAEWLKAMDRLVADVESDSFELRRAQHGAWWREFWQRSWIHLSQNGGLDPVPANSHAVRIGLDQDGQNKFVGQMGRMTIASGCADEKAVRELAGSRGADVASILAGPLFLGVRDVSPGPIGDSSGWTFEGGLTIETWIKAGDLPAGGGRLVDKTTPGASDGLLFDTYPGRSLRLIIGTRTISAKDVLPSNDWVHVAATVDSQTGALRLYVNGQQVASESGQELSDAAEVGRAYRLQRWVDACAGRGAFPIKFNGSIFTVPHEGKFGGADYRRWGPGYWWQNTRLPYLSMCASGDTEMMRPLFRMYAEELMDLHRYRTKLYTGHGGAFIPECLYFWGPTFTATYGSPFAKRGQDKLQESLWHKWEWVSGLELVWMMLDYIDHTEDEAYLAQVVIPTARQILTFFEEHSPLDGKGKLVMFPSQSLETWWDCTNPMPEVAGLRAVTTRLLALPESLADKSERDFWQRILAMTPDLPVWEKDGSPRLAPAERFEAKSNVENPELYAVFPFRLVSFEKPNADLGRRALADRWDRGAFGWRQDGLFMTHLGLADQARANLVSRTRNHHKASRFPVFWGPNYDWVPDQDHGGVLMRTLQTMLMQTEGRQIHLLPAWPTDWDAEFKLHAPFGTTVSGKVHAGRILDLKVVPEERAKDVVIH